jgi:hypothetical protein
MRVCWVMPGNFTWLDQTLCRVPPKRVHAWESSFLFDAHFLRGRTASAVTLTECRPGGKKIGCVNVTRSKHCQILGIEQGPTWAIPLILFGH